MKEARPFLMPKLGLTMTEGLISQWVVTEGARFSASEVLVIIETDKVAHEVVAPADGLLRRIYVSEGETVAVSTELGAWSLDGYADAPETQDTGGAVEQDAPIEEPSCTNGSTISKSAKSNRAEDSFVRASPLARRIARKESILLHQIKGSGPNGRILADDVRAAANQPRTSSNEQHAKVGLVVRSSPSANERAMASRLVASKREIPHFYLNIDIEGSGLLALRQDLNAIEGRPRVSITHLFAAAVARALTAAPHMNRVWIGDEILTYGSIDIGIAVDTDRGLMSPTVRDLGTGSFYDLVRKIDDVVRRAREGRLKTSDMQGCAITISNAGMYDVRYMASIIPPGQGSILGVGSLQQCFRPDDNGTPALKRELGLVLSADHRLHTGVSSLKFLDELRKAIASPLSLVTGI